MSTVYQAKHFTGEQLDGLMQKVATGEIAGRGLEIDGQGNLACTVPGYTKRIFTYTHTTNREVRPTALDVATGVFTAPAHGLLNGESFYVTVDYPYNLGSPYSYLPVGITLGGVANTSTCQTYYARVVDADHFGISTTSTGEIVTFTEPESLDVTKFHFEFLGRTDLTVEGLDVKECLMVVKGKIRNNIRYVHPTTRIKFGSNGNHTGAIAYDAAFGTDAYGSCYLGRPGYQYTYAELEFKMLGENEAYQVNNVDYVLYKEDGSVTFKHNRQYFHMMLSGNKIEGITMYGDLLGGFFNGTTVEVYAK